MNKKGYAITIIEIIYISILLAFGVFTWFIYQGTFNYLSAKDFSNAKMISIGVAGILAMLFLFKLQIGRFALAGATKK